MQLVGLPQLRQIAMEHLERQATVNSTGVSTAPPLDIESVCFQFGIALTELRVLAEKSEYAEFVIHNKDIY